VRNLTAQPWFDTVFAPPPLDGALGPLALLHAEDDSALWLGVVPTPPATGAGALAAARAWCAARRLLPVFVDAARVAQS
jgi:hypothetical protein